MPTLLATEGVYAVPNPDQVQRQRALDLARLALDYPERDRVELVGRLLYRVLMRTVRGGAA